MIQGVNHITLSVRDAQQSYQFYTEILGFRPVARWPRGAYLLAGETWIALVQDERLRPSSLPEYTHIAFSVLPADFEALSQRIKDSGAVIWQDNWTEGDSLYFVDPNGHKLEIHASNLAARLKAARENPWEGLEIFLDP